MVKNKRTDGKQGNVSPSTKKTKISKSNGESKSVSFGIAMEAMQYYRDYYENLGRGENAEDSDSQLKPLYEVIRVLAPDEHSKNGESEKVDVAKISSFIETLEATSKEEVETKFDCVEILTPVLLSMAYLHLWLGKSEATLSDKEGGNIIPDQNTDLSCLYYSLKHYTGNAGSLSMLANHLRINRMVSLKQLYTLYDLSAENASAIRAGAISILEKKEKDKAAKNDDDKEDDDKNEEDEEQDFKDDELMVWIEMLLLDGIAGVEYLGGEMIMLGTGDDSVEEVQEGMEVFGSEDEDDIEEEAEENNKPTKNKTDNEKNKVEMEEEEDDDDEEAEIEEIELRSTSGDYSPSEIEATSSFMAALLSATIGNHNDSLKHLRKFYITHRVHPNIWDGAISGKRGKKHLLQESNDENSKSVNDCLFTPVSFVSGESESEGILPTSVYDRLCEVFHSKASFWNESDYNNRGYYSFWLDLTKKKDCDSPQNIIEETICNHLLPLAKKTLPKDKADAIIGAEWWAHTRPIQANLGHQLHFDTDEALLEQEQKITHPVASSVLYLTTGSSNSGSGSGSTIVFDQTPDSTLVAQKAWVGQAKDNSFMVFPGNLLHGVLPCPGKDDDDELKKEEAQPIHRLTFMVGFWTRSVPDNMPKDRDLYGPCGVMPPSTDAHSWVKDIAKGYDASDNKTSVKDSKKEGGHFESKRLPFISPAWDYIEYDEDSEGDIPLDLPQGIDHRYFVHGAPNCFRDSLFKDESFLE